ncbi:DUF1450 domain-containing protein [Bacillus sp. NTK071]|uniref:DUF1450 domain-containing protein n=1 Tax=Bacillus sp. NTK071 TaxID=2802175 RepID=UPI001A8C790B|nr:DUF1450 domain-containing protein [Bacillus sp. NTK071]MBN8209898.1 DUF1450 domain-containing protein [Bacillus sp. NTK071]
MTTIEFCAGNLRENKIVWNELEKIPNTKLVDYGCLGYCGNCYSESFAIVGGVLIHADTSEALLEKIIRKLNERD